jgi:hypothetical protein
MFAEMLAKKDSGLKPAMPQMNLGELQQKKDGLKDGGGGMDLTHTGTVTRDSQGKAQHGGFTLFTPEHERIMAIYDEGGEVGAKDWAGLAAKLPEYCLSVELLTSKAPATAKAFAWNTTEGKYLDEAAAAAAASSGANVNITQLSKDMENTQVEESSHSRRKTADELGCTSLTVSRPPLISQDNSHVLFAGRSRDDRCIRQDVP